MDQLETAVAHGRGFNDPVVQKKAQEAAAEARSQRGVNKYLVTTEPDYKMYPNVTAEDFMPSKNMRTVLSIALDLDSSRISDWMKEAGLTRQTWYAWVRIPGFKEWWNKSFQEAIKSYANEWLTIGIKKMRLDYRYWKDMGEKLFGYIPKMQIEKTGSEDEKKLTDELTRLFRNINQKAEAKIIPATVEEIKEGETNERVTDTSGNDGIKSNDPPG